MDENALTITAAWNDVAEEEEYQSTKDLDLVVLDSDGKQVGLGNRAQVENSDTTRQKSRNGLA